MSFPAAIIVEGVPAQLSAAAHLARTVARPTAAAGSVHDRCKAVFEQLQP
jgi:hypothetical protein